MALFVFESNTSGHYSYSNRIVLSSPGTIRIRIEYLWPLFVFASNTYLTKNHYSYSNRIPLATIRIRFEYVSHPKPLFVFASNTYGHYSYSNRITLPDIRRYSNRLENVDLHPCVTDRGTAYGGGGLNVAK